MDVDLKDSKTVIEDLFSLSSHTPVVILHRTDGAMRAPPLDPSLIIRIIRKIDHFYHKKYIYIYI